MVSIQNKLTKNLKTLKGDFVQKIHFLMKIKCEPQKKGRQWVCPIAAQVVQA